VIYTQNLLCLETGHTFLCSGVSIPPECPWYSSLQN